MGPVSEQPAETRQELFEKKKRAGAEPRSKAARPKRPTQTPATPTSAEAGVPSAASEPITRRFTTVGSNPFDEIEWEQRSSAIMDEQGNVVHELPDLEVPKSWSQLATDILALKYIRKAGVPKTGHETGARAVVHRIVHSIREAGEKMGGYFAKGEEADTFEAELAHVLIHQKAAFNSPVWFNCGLYHQYGIQDQGRSWYWNFEANAMSETKNAYEHPQCSACFIQKVHDNLDSIYELVKTEARLFKYGSGTGSNFSPLRAKFEKLSSGGTSSGVMSFLEVFDRGAGATKSGGTTRRAAKMVILDMDHPEITDFINWKVHEEKKAAALIAAGYPADFNGEVYKTVSGQNSNNSVRVTDEFIYAVKNDNDWVTKYRTTGQVHETYKARELWNMIAQAAWASADPGIQYDTTINAWHTCPNTERINASNPCSEYMFLDDSACNLASINLAKYLLDDGGFDMDGYRHTIKVITTAQEILVDFSSYPTQTIGQNSHDYRPLGLGYANLGTLLMLMGIPYDSDKGRAIAGALTAVLTGKAYQTSSEIAARIGPFSGYGKNQKPFLRVMRKHRAAAYALNPDDAPPDMLNAAQQAWDEALRAGEQYGYRNAQATVIAPTGTIGLLMDCDTTGIEPDFALVKLKKLAGGGFFKIVNQSVPEALRRLGYSEGHVAEIVRYATGSMSLEGAPHINTQTLTEKGLTQDDLIAIEGALHFTFELEQAFAPWVLGQATLERLGLSEQAKQTDFSLLHSLGFTKEQIAEASDIICGRGTVEGAPHLKAEHLPVFDCANKCGKYGTRFIAPMGHVKMMAAAQPFISGAISKTVNMPQAATVEEVAEIYMQGWKLGLKAIALYRDGSKHSQPLNITKDKVEKAEEQTKIIYRPLRHKMPDERRAITHKFNIAGHKGYLTVGLFEDGTPGELFITMSKEGSTISGMMDAFATAVSIALQYGVPLRTFINKFAHMRFEPAGFTNHPQIRIAKSMIDYIFRWMAWRFMSIEDQRQVGVNFTEEQTRVTKTLTDKIEAERIPTFDPPTGKLLQRDTGNETPVTPVQQGLLSAEPEDSAQKQALNFSFNNDADAPGCADCGAIMVRNGTCYKCMNCGSTSGCS